MDELYEKVLELYKEDNDITPSKIQKKLNIGLGRASKLYERLKDDKKVVKKITNKDDNKSLQELLDLIDSMYPDIKN